MGLVAGLVALVLVLDPMELSPVEPVPMAPEDAPIEEELPMLLELSEDGEGDVLTAGGVTAGVVVVSSAFLPQAPRASNAARATAVAAAGLILGENM
ncbi:MAG: hypothetical protein V4573_18285 [Pseudomonadota bacterium]